MLGIVDPGADLIEETVSGAEKYVTLQFEEIQLRPFIGEYSIMRGGPIYVTLLMRSGESVLNNVYIAVVDQKENYASNNPHSDTVQITEKGDESQDYDDDGIVGFCQAKPGVVEPFHKKVHAQKKEEPAEDKPWEKCHYGRPEEEHEGTDGGSDDTDDAALRAHFESEPRDTEGVETNRAAPQYLVGRCRILPSLTGAISLGKDA